MTKLEEKLKELGYHDRRKTHPDSNEFMKVNGEYCLSIFVIDNKIVSYEVFSHKWFFKEQKQIDNLQQAFNNLKADIEEAKKYE